MQHELVFALVSALDTAYSRCLGGSRDMGIAGMLGTPIIGAWVLLLCNGNENI